MNLITPTRPQFDIVSKHRGTTYGRNPDTPEGGIAFCYHNFELKFLLK